MTTSDLARPLSLRELVNQLNRPTSLAVEGIPIEQDWLEALRTPFAPENNVHVQSMATLIDEIARLRTKLSLSETRRAELEELIDADPLCPVLNRRAFERELNRAIAWSKRSGKAGSVLFIDMNGLKKINDTYGHAIGDRAIERVAKMLILSCRTTDQIGRLGGDEFAVIMPDTPTSGAIVRGERVADLLGRVPLLAGDISLNLSAAYGAASFNGEDTSKEVLEKADAAMYVHKQAHKAALLGICVPPEELGLNCG